MRYLRERWWLLLVLCVLGVVVWAAGICGYLAWVNRHGVVSMANFHRLHSGMKRTEVELLLGGPGQQREQVLCDGHDLRSVLASEWTSGSLTIAVAFDGDVVLQAWWIEDRPPSLWRLLEVQLGI